MCRLQPVSRRNPPESSVRACPGGWCGAVRLHAGAHRCQSGLRTGDNLEWANPENGKIRMNSKCRCFISCLQRDTSECVFEDFPSLITGQVLPRVTDPSPVKRMIAQLLSTIRSCGKLTHLMNRSSYYLQNVGFVILSTLKLALFWKAIWAFICYPWYPATHKTNTVLYSPRLKNIE